MHETIGSRNGDHDNARMHRRDPREIIRELLSARGWSERELAERANVDQSALNRYMRGDTQWLNTRTLTALADCLGVTSSQLLGEMPLDADPRTLEVLRAMEAMPDYLKDVVVATTKTLRDSGDIKH